MPPMLSVSALATRAGYRDNDLPPFWWTRVTAYAAAASCSFCIGVM